MERKRRGQFTRAISRGLTNRACHWHVCRLHRPSPAASSVTESCSGVSAGRWSTPSAGGLDPFITMITATAEGNGAGQHPGGREDANGLHPGPRRESVLWSNLANSVALRIASIPASLRPARSMHNARHRFPDGAPYFESYATTVFHAADGRRSVRAAPGK
jgi:hypothetical protein